MFETVVVPLDGSELAEAALDQAREIAGKFGSTVILLRAIDPVSRLIATQAPGLYETPTSAQVNVELLEEVVDAERAEATKYLEAVQTRIGGKCEYVVVEGSASDAIIDVAQEKKAGLIVMSSHGRGGLGRVVFGSVAGHILHHSHIPVLLIRLQEEDEKK